MSEHKEPKCKIYFNPSNDVGWCVASDDVAEATAIADELKIKFASATPQDIQVVDQAVVELGLPDVPVSTTSGNLCNQCGKAMNHIPAGTSKRTGKAYQAFDACPDRCKQ